MKEIIRHPNGRVQVRTINNEPSKTDQSMKDECDVNEILRKYMKTGQINLPNQHGQYLDVSDIQDLHLALTQVNEATQAFDQLPPEIRRRFGNSLTELVSFLDDPQNNEEAIKLGLKVLTNPDGTPYQASVDKAHGRVSPPYPSSRPKSKKNQPKASQNDDELNDDESAS